MICFIFSDILSRQTILSVKIGIPIDCLLIERIWYNAIDMRNYAIIPIFIPHNGCPNDCVFCNQKKITARSKSPTQAEVVSVIDRNLKTITEADTQNVEIGFFGGSFTGLSISDQNYYLSVAKSYKDSGKIKGIRLSTRPDYINKEILENLKMFSVDLIELGVQSFDDEVLIRSERGHTKEQVKEAAALINEYGFDLGIQLMIGLPGDTPKKSVHSARELTWLNPSVARLYPTVVLKDTKLMDMYKSGEYEPFTDNQMIETATDMYEIINNAGINVIRIGLKSTDLIQSGSSDIAGDYHPAFSEIVQGKSFQRKMIVLIDEWLSNNQVDQNKNPVFTFHCNSKDISKVIGHNKQNKEILSKNYPHLIIKFSGSNDCSLGSLSLTIS